MRTCLADPEQLAHHEMSVTSAARRFTKEVIRFSDSDSLTVSHRLFSVRPNLKEGSRQNLTVGFATKAILGFISCAYVTQDRATRLRLCNMIHGHPWFGTSALAGYFYET